MIPFLAALARYRFLSIIISYVVNIIISMNIKQVNVIESKLLASNSVSVPDVMLL